MPLRLGKFELPKRLVKDEKTNLGNFGRYIAEPFETGYGTTIGNSLRRVLLSSIEGAAITAIKIDGVDHEFQSIDGVIEDVTDIILNLKRVLFKTNKREPATLILDVNKEGEITAGDISLSPQVSIVNPDQLICTIDKKQRFYAEIEIKVGRGYCSWEENKTGDQVIGVLPIDSLFSPVISVNYTIENTRVGQMTNYDRLVLEFKTDGRVTPDDALKQASAILKHHLDIFSFGETQTIEFEVEEASIDDEQNKLRKLLNMSVNEIELSVRAANCLNNANITTVGELTTKSEPEMLKYRNFGKKSLKEIKDKLEQLGLSLGMAIDDRLLTDSE